MTKMTKLFLYAVIIVCGLLIILFLLLDSYSREINGVGYCLADFYCPGKNAYLHD